MNANVGMLHPVAAPITAYTPGTGVTYGTGAVISEARSANLTWERADGHFYGDDVELDTDNSILGYTIEFEPSGLTDAQRALLLGEVNNSDVYSVTDAAPPDVGFGYVRRMRATNTSGVVVESFEGWWFHKIKFGISNEETRTRERSTEWRVPTMSGTGMGVSLDATGVLTFAEHKTFATLATAIAFVNGKAGITG